MRDRSVASLTRGTGPSGWGPASSRSHKLFFLLGVAVLSTLVLGVALASAVAPTVTIDPTPTAGYTTAQVFGTVDPGDNQTTVYIEYSKEPATEGWQFSFAASLAAGSGATPVSGELTGLTPGTQYFVRIGAENGVDPEVVSAEPNPTFTTKVVMAPVVTIEPVTTFTGTTALFSGEITPGGTDPAFNTNWHFECQPACPALQGGEVPADTAAHQVSVEAKGLAQNTTYTVSLVAENLGGSETAVAPDFTTPTTGPELQNVMARPLFTEATLGGQVNPGGLQTIYFFEYGATANYGSRTAPKTLPAGGGPASVKANIEGLSPGGIYHFKLVASNSLGSSESIDQTFTTQTPGAGSDNCPNAAIREQQGSSYLPECRAYELVTPVDKVAGAVAFPAGVSPGDPAAQPGLETVTRDGQKLAYYAYTGFAEPLTGLVASYRAERTQNGWTSAMWSPGTASLHPSLLTGIALIRDASDDLSLGITQTNDPLNALDQDPGFLFPAEDVYSLAPGGPISWDSRPNEEVPVTGTANSTYVGRSATASQIYFQTAESLVPAASGQLAGQSLYVRTAGRTELVGVKSDGSLISSCGSSLGGIGPSGPRGIALPTTGDVSGDGNRVFFSAPDRATAGDPTCEEPTQLYLRQGGNTVDVSASQRNPSNPDPGGEREALFQGATPDGSKVFFLSEQALTDSATPGSGRMLYEYDVAGGILNLLTPTGAIAGVTGFSDDGSRVYFLTEGNELELYSDGHITNVASFPVNEPVGRSALIGKGASARVTPDGSRLLFASRENLTPYESHGFVEIYLYDTLKNEILCVSCNPDGEAPTEDANLGGDTSGGATTTYPQTRSLTENGREAFFNTQDSLVPQDTNGVSDVYEWDEGHLSLLSSGRSASGGYFFGASVDGKDVFIGTAASLAPQDVDNGARDLYDVRVNGGFLTTTAGRECGGEGCQGSPAPAPGLGSPGSEGLSGAGNVPRAANRPCPKGKVKAKSKGKVQCRKPKKKKTKIHPKPKHAKQKKQTVDKRRAGASQASKGDR